MAAMPGGQLYYQPTPSGIAPGPHNHITCGGCQTLLMYPQQGADNVRCARCGHITSARMSQANPPGAAQVVCNGCRVLLSYPRGAQSVQCSLCHTVTQAPQAVYGHVTCGGCSTMLMYPMGAQSVKCSVCHFVTNVAANGWGPGGAGGGAGAGGSGQASGSRPAPKQTVVVENPPTLDEQGNEVTNIAVGVKDT